jgi:Stress responsive A/B Barrel Domain
MYIHTFLFQWQPNVTPEMQERASREIHALQGQIPGLLETSYGVNMSPRSQGFTHGGVMKFHDQAALEGSRRAGLRNLALRQAAELDVTEVNCLAQ